VSITSLLTPVLNEHRGVFERMASEKLGTPIMLKQVSLGWYGFSPRISLEHVTLLDPKTEQPKINVQQINITLSIWRSLWAQQLLVRNITVSGLSLTVTQQESGWVQVGNLAAFNLADTMTGASVQTDAMMAWIFSQPRLALKNIDVRLVMPHSAPKLFTLTALSLKNTAQSHLLKGNVTLHQDIPTHLNVNLEWEGDVRKMANATGHVQIGMDSLSLPQWFGTMSWSDMQVRQGIISGTVEADWENNAFERIKSTFQVSNLDIYSPHQKRIQFGITNLAGNLTWNGQKAKLTIDNKNTTMTVGALFATPLAMQKLQGTFDITKDTNNAWVLQGNDVRVENEDIATDTQFALSLPQTGSPQMDLSATFSVANAGHLVNYLPTQVFDPDLTVWLSRGFSGGIVQSGKVVVQGNLADFPFDKNNGKFLITGQIKDLDFNYGPGWPHLTKVDATLTFSGSAMTVDVTSGQLLGVSVEKVHGEIPYLGSKAPQIVNVSTVVHTDLAEGVRFIQASPLRKTIGKELAGLDLKGPMQLGLQLSIPIKKPGEAKVIGDTMITDAVLSVPNWKLTLDQLKGSYQFTENGIEAKNLQGQLLGFPVTLDITTLHQDKSTTIRTNLSGMVTIPTLQDWLEMSFPKTITGAAHYQAQLFLSSQDKSSNHVTVQTNLVGVAIDLPQPFGKKIADMTTFQADIEVNQSKLLKAKLQYADLLSAALNLQQSKQGFKLQGGEVHIGTGSAAWQTEPGLLLTANLPTIDWDTWHGYFNSMQSDNAKNSHAMLDVVHGVDLNAGVINFSGLQLHKAHVNASHSNNAWLINIESQELGGKLTLPLDLDRQPVQGDMQHVYLSSSMTTGGKQILDPTHLPALSLAMNDLRYNDIKIGHVVLETEPSHSGLTITKLQIDEPFFELDAAGDWDYNQGKSESHLKGNMNSARISDVLKQWGFSSSNFIGSNGLVTFDIHWPDAPYLIGVANMSGDVSLKLGEGRIVELGESGNAKMGLGRLLNLFSLSTIPRRLSLDFSDLVEKGYSFDSLNADFTLKSGNAMTNNMRFEGPVASIYIKGRIGLHAKDVDLKLGVTPHVTGSLPVVAAIAGGPVVGVATWVVGSVVSHAVSQVSTYQYVVTGSWDHPVWSQTQTVRQAS
jgi:uncharacterized protein (TIGR02099 family)